VHVGARQVAAATCCPPR